MLSAYEVANFAQICYLLIRWERIHICTFWCSSRCTPLDLGQSWNVGQTLNTSFITIHVMCIVASTFIRVQLGFAFHFDAFQLNTIMLVNRQDLYQSI